MGKQRLKKESGGGDKGGIQGEGGKMMKRPCEE